jgi:hypothetical protein
LDEFWGFDFVNGNTLRNDGDTQSITKEKATKIDSVFITFHPNDKSRVICTQLFIENFKPTAEDTAFMNIQLVG